MEKTFVDLCRRSMPYDDPHGGWLGLTQDALPRCDEDMEKEVRGWGSRKGVRDRISCFIQRVGRVAERDARWILHGPRPYHEAAVDWQRENNSSFGMCLGLLSPIAGRVLSLWADTRLAQSSSCSGSAADLLKTWVPDSSASPKNFHISPSNRSGLLRLGKCPPVS